MNVDPAVLAGATVAALTPYLATGATELAKTLGKEVAEGSVKLVGWLKSKLTGPAAEALAEVERKPDDADNHAVLRVQLRKLLEAQPALCQELQPLLAALPIPSVQQILVQSGTGHKAVQVSGDQNRIAMD